MLDIYLIYIVCGGDALAERVMLGTTVDSELKNQFKKKCDELGLTMSEVIDKFMEEVLSGEIVLEKHIIVKRKNQ